MVKNTRLGKLYIVSTPIGNLGDITHRSIEVLNKVDLCLVEDTRVARKLLNHYQVKTRLLSYHRFSEKKKLEQIITKIKDGQVLALLSDAGTPLISDPGFLLVQEVVSIGAEVVVCPGPSSVIAALTASGFNLENFSFFGFSPSSSSQKINFLRELMHKSETLVFFETPRNILKTLGELDALMPERLVCVCREMTKLYETYYRGTPSELMERLKNDPNSDKGELVVVVSPVAKRKSKDNTLNEEEIRVLHLISSSLSINESSKIAAKIFNKRKKIFYDFLSD